MYSARQLRIGAKWAVSSPNLLMRELNRLYHTRLYRHDYNVDGIDVMAEDWDNLLVLDACRYDVFEDQHGLDGELSARTSRAAHTSEFLLGNFHERDLRDTVYVTASPMLQRGYGEKYEPDLHEIVNVWHRDGWDEAAKTVRPETMAEYARDAAEQYSDKRLVVHFMQPHYPFIGADFDIDKRSVPDPEEITSDIWMELMRGRLALTAEEVWDAYCENLDRVLPHVEQLLADLGGKTVVTSDHGNMFGERASPLPIREWGHPPGVHTDALTTVPWLESTNGSRRRIVAERSRSDDESIDDDLVSDRLADLGYAD